jgi:hypothetical protein
LNESPSVCLEFCFCLCYSSHLNFLQFSSHWNTLKNVFLYWSGLLLLAT